MNRKMVLRLRKPWRRDHEALNMLLELIAERPIQHSLLGRCSDEEIRLLEQWAASVHLRAGDHPVKRRHRPFLYSTLEYLQINGGPIDWAGAANDEEKRPDELQQQMCDEWNRRYPIGTEVRYFPIIDDADNPAAKHHLTKTRTQAYILSGHTAVLFVENISGCVALAAVRPIRKEPQE